MCTATIGHATGALHCADRCPAGRRRRRSSRRAGRATSDDGAARERSAPPRRKPAPEPLGVCRCFPHGRPPGVAPDAAVIPSRRRSGQRPEVQTGLSMRRGSKRARMHARPCVAAARWPDARRDHELASPSATPHAAIGTKTSSSRKALNDRRGEDVAEREHRRRRSSASSRRSASRVDARRAGAARARRRRG